MKRISFELINDLGECQAYIEHAVNDEGVEQYSAQFGWALQGDGLAQFGFVVRQCIDGFVEGCTLSFPTRAQALDAIDWRFYEWATECGGFIDDEDEDGEDE